jgi:alpha-glucosidase
VERLFADPDTWPTWVLSNHDQPRHRTRYGSDARARAAAVLLLTLRGTPFLYAGEELGLEDAEVPPARQVDPGGRDGCRAPLPWDSSPSHGWAGGPDAWLPWPPGAAGSRNAAAQRDDPGSMARLYRRLLALRRGSEALRSGEFSWVETPEGVLAYTRHSAGGDRRLVAVNFGSDPAGVVLPAGRWVVAVSSVGPGGEAASGRLGLAGDEAVVLRPAQPA